MMPRVRILFLLGLILFGNSARAQIEVGGSRIDVVFESGDPGVPRATVLDWIRNCADSVANYYGRFPVSHVTVRIASVEGDEIESGKTFGTRNGGLITIALGRATTQAHFERDWLMTHEMVHLALPDMPERNHWIEEGIATYVEPIARVRSGRLRVEQFWSELIHGLPQGLPEAGDRGLDFTHTWGRTYWGGALFCFLADVEIRQRTGNAKGLIDALRGIQAAGGSLSVDWEMERALRVGDKATGVPVLEELYQKMRAAPSPVDLDEMWRKLGLERRGRGVVFHDDAPWAATRRALTAAD